MRRNYFIIVMALIVGLVMSQINFIGRINTEAKNYGQPYGDITPEEDESSFEARYVANRYEPRSGHRLGINYHDEKYQSEYALPALNRKRGEQEKNQNQYKSLDTKYNNRNNRKLNRNNSNAWMVSSNIVEEQYENITEEINENLPDYKCRIWVPMDALDKYPGAEKKQDNKIAGSVYIEICCKGYAAMRWRGKTLCRPICENCQNGRCIAPGVCECYDEYVANDNGDCVFTCPMGCLNGRCYLDGSCQCDAGYKLDGSRKFCRPICSKGCGTNRLHNCTEPEVCGCIKGYVLSDNGCQPVCQHDCGSGGICREPDVCECNPGFDLKDGFCQADCYQKCDNGICFSRNRCICNPGFTYHERSTQCIPK